MIEILIKNSDINQCFIRSVFKLQNLKETESARQIQCQNKKKSYNLFW